MSVSVPESWTETLCSVLFGLSLTFSGGNLLTCLQAESEKAEIKVPQGKSPKLEVNFHKILIQVTQVTKVHKSRSRDRCGGSEERGPGRFTHTRETLLISIISFA